MSLILVSFGQNSILTHETIAKMKYINVPSS